MLRDIFDSIRMKYFDKAALLKSKLDYLVGRKEYQRGFEVWSDNRPKTFCNLLAWYLLDRTLPKTKYGPFTVGYNKDISPMLGGRSVTACPLDIAYDNIMKNKVRLVEPEEAQMLANEGEPVMAICKAPKFEHVMIVCPDDEPYDENTGPLVEGAGWWNGCWKVNDPRCWGQMWNKLGVIYVVFAEREQAA